MIPDILASPNDLELHRYLLTKPLLAFDFDGTLAPIVARRDEAEMSGVTRQLLGRVARRYPAAIFSGRSRADVAARVAGLPLKAIIGNHGLENGDVSNEMLRAVAAWNATLEPALAGVEGVDIEDKGATLSVHFRAARDVASAERAIRDAVSLLSPTPRIVGGKRLLNLLPNAGIDKGTAVQSMMRDFGTPAALFVGDDETDEDVFALYPEVDILSVRVGSSERSRARYCIRSQRQIDLLLLRILELSTASSKA
jgi:trehalose 6-phosphate phosphatase